MRIAIVGGTGPFGTALATRLGQAGYDIVLGSRDASRASVAARELGVEGAMNAEAVRDADLVVLATKADATLEAARELREAIGSIPVLSVASELRFSPSGALGSDELSSLAERLQTELDGPVLAGLHSLAASTLARTSRPTRTPSSAVTMSTRRASCWRSPSGSTAGRALDAGPLASARALERMTAVIVNLNKRYRGHAGIRVTGLP